MSERQRRVCARRGKGERTWVAILVAAERVFAEKGFAAARLEDVAAAVGVRRASLLYYVRDKRDLYDTVLAGIFGELEARYRRVLAAPTGASRRIEAIVEAWVDFVGARPTVARLLLWEAADGSHDRATVAAERAAAVVAALVGVIDEGQRKEAFRPIDPIHLLVTLMGATVFFVTATPRLLPAWPFDPLSPMQLAAHRAELLDVARRLLGSAAVPEEPAAAAIPGEAWHEAGAAI